MLAGVQRRGLTVLVGAIVVALLAVGVVQAPVPYVVLDAGPTVDTLGEDGGEPVIDITGTDTYPSEGQLRLVTVGVQPEPDLITAIRAWLDTEEAVVPRELIYPPGQTEEQVEQEGADAFEQSQTTAETAALRELGYPVLVTVVSVVDGGPADGVLADGDVITAVDGAEVTSPQSLRDLITAHPAGTGLTVGYTRDGATRTATITTEPDENGAPRIGVEIGPEQPHPFELEIDLDEVGGPSAGLMFALGIIDKLGAEDLTGGHVIAGTGAIDADGNVGGIGGIPQKLVGAREAGATVFLVPAPNCPEAVANAQPGITLVRVATLAGALEELSAVRAGRQPATCG
jgi:PDZ domain-containing protein